MALNGHRADWVRETYDGYRARAHTHAEALRLTAQRTSCSAAVVAACVASVKDLPTSQRIIARLYMMGASGDEAKNRKRQGLPVEGMTEAEAVRYAQTGRFER